MCTSSRQKHVLMDKPRHSTAHTGVSGHACWWGLLEPNNASETSPAHQHQPLINMPAGTDTEVAQVKCMNLSTV